MSARNDRQRGSALSTGKEHHEQQRKEAAQVARNRLALLVDLLRQSSTPDRQNGFWLLVSQFSHWGHNKA
jgi:hypothetical protein